MSQRLHYRRRLSYRTRSNQVRIVKTPGGRLTYIYAIKKAGVPKCGDCKRPLQGLPSLRPARLSQLSKRQKTVNRAYGGSRCHSCVRDRVLRAFLLEEQKIVKRVLKSKAAPAAIEKPEKKAEKKTAVAPEKTEKKPAAKPTTKPASRY